MAREIKGAPVLGGRRRGRWCPELVGLEREGGRGGEHDELGAPPGARAGLLHPTYLDVEADEGQADAVRHADGRQEPDLGRRGPLVLDVADDLLGGLALVALPLHPLVQPGLLQGAVEEDEELDVAVEAGLGQRRQVAQHVVPLPAAHPVRVEAPVEPVQAVVGVDEEAQGGLGGPLPAATHQAAPGQLLQLHRHHGAGAVLLDVVLEALHSHGGTREGETERAADVGAAASRQAGWQAVGAGGGQLPSGRGSSSSCSSSSRSSCESWDVMEPQLRWVGGLFGGWAGCSCTVALQGGVVWISGGFMAAAAAMCCSHTAMAQGIRASAVAAAAAAPTAGGRKEGREERERAGGEGGERRKGKERKGGGRKGGSGTARRKPTHWPPRNRRDLARDVGAAHARLPTGRPGLQRRRRLSAPLRGHPREGWAGLAGPAPGYAALPLPCG